MKKFFHITNLNFLWHNLRPFVTWSNTEHFLMSCHSSPSSMIIDSLFSLPFLLRSIAASRRTSNSPFGNTGTTHRGLYSKTKPNHASQLCFLKMRNLCSFLMKVKKYAFLKALKGSTFKRKATKLDMSISFRLLPNKKYFKKTRELEKHKSCYHYQDIFTNNLHTLEKMR